MNSNSCQNAAAAFKSASNVEEKPFFSIYCLNIRSGAVMKNNKLKKSPFPQTK